MAEDGDSGEAAFAFGGLGVADDVAEGGEGEGGGVFEGGVEAGGVGRRWGRRVERVLDHGRDIVRCRGGDARGLLVVHENSAQRRYCAG